MTTINQELYEALIAAGAPDDVAKRAAASVISRDDLSQLATKADLAELKSDLIKWMAGLIFGSMGFMTTLFVVIVKFL
jgi:cation transport ATPase